MIKSAKLIKLYAEYQKTKELIEQADKEIEGWNDAKNHHLFNLNHLVKLINEEEIKGD